MLKKTILLLFSFTIISGLLAEAFESNHESDSQINSIEVSYKVLVENQCPQSDCSDSDNHCIHHCSGTHNLIHFYSNFSYEKFDLGIKLTNNYNFIYNEPYIGLNLKPPREII